MFLFLLLLAVGFIYELILGAIDVYLYCAVDMKK